MFDYAVKRLLIRFNPAAAFDLADAGGKELARERALSRDELVTLFEAMRQAKGFSVQNELTVKLLLLLAVRKGVEGVYNRHDYFEERRQALEAWGKLLLKLKRGDATAKTGKAKASVARRSVTDQSFSA